MHASADHAFLPAMSFDSAPKRSHPNRHRTSKRAILMVMMQVVMLASLWAPPLLASTSPENPKPLVLVLDASGSMWGQIEGENKIVIARRVLAELINKLPNESTVGLIAYGHRSKGDCQDIETILPLGPLDRAGLKEAVDALQPTGKTPLAASVEQALEMVRASGEQATVILLSDGLETCGGDPCEKVRLAKQAGTDLLLHVVGFDIASEDAAQLQCMAQAGGGLFFGANDAGELGEALDQAVALPVDSPVGRLAIRATADGELLDVSIRVRHLESGDEAAVSRTYTNESTNPSSIPLADGSYEAQISAIGIKGDNRRQLSFEIAGGSLVEHHVDFSTGELQIGVTRNGALSDAVYAVDVEGTNQQVKNGRTYVRATSNPAKVRITSGRYEVRVKSVEMKGSDWLSLGAVEVMPQGTHPMAHDFKSGRLSIGTKQGDERIDTVIYVEDLVSGKSVAQGRTYVGPPSNPKSYELAPGRYRVKAKTLKKPAQILEVEVEIKAEGHITHEFDFSP